MVWIARLGCELDPAYVADYNALRRERRHAHENAERPGRWRPMVGARWKEVCDKWEWRLAADGEFRYITPFGEVDLQRDSHAAIERHTRMAWERALLRSEPRADDERSRELFGDPAVEAVVSGHVKRAQRLMGKRYQMESVTASTVDGKDLQRIVARRTGEPAARRSAPVEPRDPTGAIGSGSARMRAHTTFGAPTEVSRANCSSRWRRSRPRRRGELGTPIRS